MSNDRAPGASPPVPRPPGTFKVGTVAGTDVLLTRTWFVVALVIAVFLAPAVDRAQPGLGSLKYVAGLAFAVLLYLSVLLHEAAHAVAAKHFNLPVSSITLHFMGGMTAIETEPEHPRQEFWISVVGPLTSVAVGLVAAALTFVAPGGLIGLAVGAIASANLIVGAVNLLPGLPLDGGRVLKAAVWRGSGDVHKGTVVAAWGGRVLALLAFVGWPLLTSQIFGGEPTAVDFLFAGMISIFLWSGATAALTSARVRSRLPHLVARDLARRTLTVPGELPLSEAVRRAQEVEAGSIVTVSISGHPVGVVNEAALLSVPEDRRPWVAVSTVARTLDEGLRLPAGIGGEDLIRAISARPAGEYLLLDPDGSIFGVLSTADVDRAFRAHA
jgi:Zn-dependent protease